MWGQLNMRLGPDQLKKGLGGDIVESILVNSECFQPRVANSEGL